ncbi:F0F1 ATP synthase subunit delta [Desulfocastanea catecholica]
MELNWTTFVLEIVNFLVLVWLLQRFFYKPVKGVMEKRRQDIDLQLLQAEEGQQQAEELRRQYENRLADWENERQDARQKLRQEIDAEHQRLLSELQLQLEDERKKNDVLVARQAEERQRQSETRALELGARFVARLLEELACEEIQSRLIELLMVELKDLHPEQKETLAAMAENGRPTAAQVSSAYPLDQTQRAALKRYLDTLLSHPLQYSWTQDAKLLAGVRITVGPWVIHANLYDELKSFAAIAHGY